MDEHTLLPVPTIISQTPTFGALSSCLLGFAFQKPDGCPKIVPIVSIMQAALGQGVTGSYFPNSNLRKQINDQPDNSIQ